MTTGCTRGLTNHENLFLDHAGTLRALSCDVLYAIPIELAYSRCRGRLNDVYGAEILTLPTIPVAGPRGDAGLRVLQEIVTRRAARAGLTLDGIFPSRERLEAVLRYSGGHVRGLFVIVGSLLDRTDRLPISEEAVGRGLRRAAADIALGLRPGDWELLDQVRATHQPVGEDSGVWNGFLRDRFVLAYEGDDGYWYDRNPLLDLADPRRR